MTEEQIKQTSKITEFARNMVKQSNYPIDLQDHIIATCMVVVTEATKELEKENAELKEKYVKNITDCDICDTYCNSQLTKAKEIIKAFLDSSDLNIKHKAEEFLGEF